MLHIPDRRPLSDDEQTQMLEKYDKAVKGWRDGKLLNEKGKRLADPAYLNPPKKPSLDQPGDVLPNDSYTTDTEKFLYYRNWIFKKLREIFSPL